MNSFSIFPNILCNDCRYIGISRRQPELVVGSVFVPFYICLNQDFPVGNRLRHCIRRLQESAFTWKNIHSHIRRLSVCRHPAFCHFLCAKIPDYCINRGTFAGNFRAVFDISVHDLHIRLRRKLHGIQLPFAYSAALPVKDFHLPGRIVIAAGAENALLTVGEKHFGTPRS